MPRYDDHHSSTRLYVGHLSSRTRTRDLEDLIARYGSRSPSPVKRERERSYDDFERRPRSPDDPRNPPKRGSSPSPRDRSPSPRMRDSPENQKWANGSDYGNSSRGRSRSRNPFDDADTVGDGSHRSPGEENDHDRSPSPVLRDEDDHGGVDDNGGSPRGSE